jgi:hypothetical protein
MDNFWVGFLKKAQAITAPKIPGVKPREGSPSAFPGQGALIPGATPGVMKNAPSSRGL